MSPELFAVIATSIVRLIVLLAVFLYLHAINLDNAPCELCSALRSRRERRNAKLRQRKLWKKAFRRSARTVRMLREADAWLRQNRGILVAILCSNMHELVALSSCDSYVVVFCIVACGSKGHVRAGMVVVHKKAGSVRKKEDRCTFI